MALPKNRKSKPTPQIVDNDSTTPRRDLEGNIINPYDEAEVFERIPLDDALADDDGHFEIEKTISHDEPEKKVVDDTSSQSDEVVLVPRAYREKQAAQNKAVDQNSGDKDNNVVKLDDGSRRTEVDVKNKMILPFGSSRRKQKVTKAERDARKNNARNANLGGKIIITGLCTILAMGVYSMIPKDGLTNKEQRQVASISAQVNNTTGFPINAGGGIATDFIKAYLTVQSDTDTNDILGYYYTGTLGAKANASSNTNVARVATSTFSQTLVYEPTLYGAIAKDGTMAQYTVGAYVQKKATEGDKVTTEKPKMVFFSVNVIFDKDTQTFSIAPDSPTLVPGTVINSQRDLPPAEALGLGKSDTALAEQIKSVVNGYVQGYTISSESDTSALEQYTTANANITTKRGLGGTMELASGNNAVTFEAFPSAKDGDVVTEIKARVKVTWVDKVKNEDAKSVSANPAQVTYGSQYVMTLERQADGRFLVSKFVPEAYVPAS